MHCFRPLRSGAAWANPRASIAERFNYLYSPEELSALQRSLERLSDEAETVHIFFSNCIRDYAVLGAQGLCSLWSADRVGGGSTTGPRLVPE